MSRKLTSFQKGKYHLTPRRLSRQYRIGSEPFWSFVYNHKEYIDYFYEHLDVYEVSLGRYKTIAFRNSPKAVKSMLPPIVDDIKRKYRKKFELQ